ncbi:MAG: hypothetical protein GWN01_15945 [Nitrosopumilaceae archaeon]|nr:hypothetical protein [Nitrosopumilaceae archaeon]NIU02329.1 hypothetical protein [Nitrosopumilaceae archaeon]NIU88784.1 hypothetical protein [Nitrosopumilaceae archaeon]NIV66911.1 hypothetical protein [Nitrosopumilaceae archaeon]NIX62930.1 hypothetical protein [Nitrosopumilaceae archaeon]
MRATLLLVVLAIGIISVSVFSSAEFFAFAQDGSERPEQHQDSEKGKSEKSKEKLDEKLAKIEEKREKVRQNTIEKAQETREKQEELRQKIKKLQSSSEKIPTQKVEKVKERLYEKIDKLNQKTASILEKIQKGKYLGEKHGMDSSVNFTIRFIDVTADAIGNETTTILDGNLNMTTFDVGKKNLKFEVTACDIVVGEIEYVCGFGKARTISSGNDGTKDSLVIIAFLEDSVMNKLHTTLKIFLESNQPIMETKDNTVSILGPQSTVSHQWFLNGTAQLSQIESQSDEFAIDDIEETQKDPKGRNLTINLEESVGIAASP